VVAHDVKPEAKGLERGEARELRAKLCEPAPRSEHVGVPASPLGSIGSSKRGLSDRSIMRLFHASLVSELERAQPQQARNLCAHRSRGSSLGLALGLELGCFSLCCCGAHRGVSCAESCVASRSSRLGHLVKGRKQPRALPENRARDGLLLPRGLLRRLRRRWGALWIALAQRCAASARGVREHLREVSLCGATLAIVGVRACACRLHGVREALSRRAIGVERICLAVKARPVVDELGRNVGPERRGAPLVRRKLDVASGPLQERGREMEEAEAVLARRLLVDQRCRDQFGLGLVLIVPKVVAQCLEHCHDLGCREPCERDAALSQLDVESAARAHQLAVDLDAKLALAPHVA